MRVRAYQENEAFRKRRDKALEILDKKVKPVKQEGEEGEEGSEVVAPRENRGKPITREEVLELEYRALVSTGQTLYYRNEYHRAIEAFTKAINNNKEELGILIDRANCYIQVGNPKAALIDINNVLKNHPDDTRAILAKAEAFFSMGEFEFALVFFERGLAIRSDLSAFKDGITKSTHAIEDSIKGEKPFEPNPNFAVSRPRKPLISVKKKTPLVAEDEDDVKPEDLLPEKVPALTMTRQEKSGFLGELALDYDYLTELREEVIAGSDDKYGEKEDKEILKIANNALIYLEQRAQFWSQQGTPDARNCDNNNSMQPTSTVTTTQQQNTIAATNNTTTINNNNNTNFNPGANNTDGHNRPVSSARRNPPKITKVTKDGTRPITPRRGNEKTDQVPHYEMSKYQIYEARITKKRSQ